MAKRKLRSRRDARMKCACCRRWMRFKPTMKTPMKRRRAPFASVCTVCQPQTEVGYWREDMVHCARRGCNVVDALAELVR